MDWERKSLGTSMGGIGIVSLRGTVGSYPKGGIEVRLDSSDPSHTRPVLMNPVQGVYTASYADGKVRLWTIPGVEAKNAKNINLDLLFLFV